MYVSFSLTSRRCELLSSFLRGRFIFTRIACVCCPSLYVTLLRIKPESSTITLLEYDSRFGKFGEDFVYYDYKNPHQVPSSLHHSFDLVVADPPFLSEECLSKVSETVKLLAKDKIILCTGVLLVSIPCYLSYGPFSRLLTNLPLHFVGCRLEHDMPMFSVFCHLSNCCHLVSCHILFHQVSPFQLWFASNSLSIYCHR